MKGLGELQTVQLVLDGLDHFDWEVSYVTFNFWYRLTDLLQQNDQNTDTFRPLLEKLLHSLTSLCQVNGFIENNLYKYLLERTRFT